eukprot:360685-Chlamydomonas_euryale.AAC.3
MALAAKHGTASASAWRLLSTAVRQRLAAAEHCSTPALCQRSVAPTQAVASTCTVAPTQAVASTQTVVSTQTVASTPVQPARMPGTTQPPTAHNHRRLRIPLPKTCAAARDVCSCLGARMVACGAHGVACMVWCAWCGAHGVARVCDVHGVARMVWRAWCGARV